MIKKKHNTEPPVQMYKGKAICRIGPIYRVKEKGTDRHALHHGSFPNAQEAREWIDYMQEQSDEA